jgi:hypothetical protein
LALYDADYPEGTLVKIVTLQDLESFRDSWRFHHPIQPEQLEYANRIVRVKSVGYYHGGDVLYQLEGIPGTWHERCLRAVENK